MQSLKDIACIVKPNVPTIRAPVFCGQVHPAKVLVAEKITSVCMDFSILEFWTFFFLHSWQLIWIAAVFVTADACAQHA